MADPDLGLDTAGSMDHANQPARRGALVNDGGRRGALVA